MSTSRARYLSLLFAIAVLAVFSQGAFAAQLISFNSAGDATANGESRSDVSVGGRLVSDDGQYVLIVSQATDLVAGITDGNTANDVFVRNRTSGVTELVSVATGGTAAGSSFSDLPTMSADGRFVAFRSNATNLVGTDSNGVFDIFLRDRTGGTTSLVSVNNGGTDSGNAASDGWPLISQDGRYIFFASNATDLVATDTNGASDVFMRDRVAGTTALVSVNSAGNDSGNNGSILHCISPDGRYVVFSSAATDLTADTDGNADNDVFLRDTVAGTTTLISVNQAGTAAANNSSEGHFRCVTPDGRYVVFHSSATDLTADTDGNSTLDVFRRDVTTGTTVLVSFNAAGTATGDAWSRKGFVSIDGRFVAYESTATDIVAGDSNLGRDIFIRDLEANSTIIASRNVAGTGTGDVGSEEHYVSADGRFVVFESSATDLTATNTGGNDYGYLFDRQLGTLFCLGLKSDGTDTANDHVRDPWISENGRWVLLNSRATDNISVTDGNGAEDIVFFDNLAAIIPTAAGGGGGGGGICSVSSSAADYPLSFLAPFLLILALSLLKRSRIGQH